MALRTAVRLLRLSRRTPTTRPRCAIPPTPRTTEPCSPTDDERLDAFWYFDWQGDVVDVGIGLRPELTGRGLGESFLRAQLDYATSKWAPATFRLFVAAWNERAIRLYERLGFSEVGRETRHFELVGEHEFIQMERTA